MPKRSARYDTSRPLLDVYLYGRLVGSLGEHEPDVWFRYAPDVAEIADERERERWSLSVRLPVVADPYGHRETLAFFDNLLIESSTRDELARVVQRDRSDLPGLLGRVGGECAGAVSLWPHGVEPPRVDAYRAYPAPELNALFDETHGARLTRAQLESRQVMSGVQHKLVFRQVDGAYQLPLNGAPGTVILKRASARYDGLVANELCCLRAFAALGLPTAPARPVAGRVDLIAVDRYDREEEAPDESARGAGAVGALPFVRRLHQEDMCQATGRSPSRKYQHSDGPGLRDLAQVIRRHSVNPAEDVRHLLVATMANLCLGNMDAHAKNFALLRTDDGVRLAPFYDVVSTEVYPESVDPVLSMKVGHTMYPKRLGPSDTERLAKDIGVTPALVRDIIGEVTTMLRARWVDVVHGVADGLPHAPVLDRMSAHLAERLPLVERMGVRSTTPRRDGEPRPTRAG